MYFDSINALRTAFPTPNIPTNGEYLVAGYAGPGDGGGGTFVWVPATYAAIKDDDDGIAIRTPLGTTAHSLGYFQRVFSGPINVKWFGAKGGLGTTDDTAAVHRARDSKEFANNGTLYFPVGTYMGAFVFDYVNSNRNEINIIGDGHGTILKPNGTSRPDGNNNPVLSLGYRVFNWKWARVSNLTIDGSYQGANYFAWGVCFENLSIPNKNEISGRWIFERVFFVNCDKAVYKPWGNIGNHFIDCNWSNNVHGIYAQGFRDDPNHRGMHSGCDRYSGCHFEYHLEVAIAYSDLIGGNGQIILDGTVIENNYNYGITIFYSDDARMTTNAICLRNVWFENNNSNNVGASDIYLYGVRTVRIDDSNINTMQLVESSINMYNCRYNSDAGNIVGNIHVDNMSSIVAYEQRYNSYPSSKIFVNSISYDGSQDIQHEAWQPTSVWGPLRVVTATILNYYLLSYQFDTVIEPFEAITYPIIPPNPPIPQPDVNTIVSLQMRVLGNGSGWIIMNKKLRITSKNIIAIIDKPKYCVWSIHAYLQSDIPEDSVYGLIATGDESIALGRVYFKKNQWACSYGMKFLPDVTTPLEMRLMFITGDFAANFFITDYQIVCFDDLASANSFVNSKEFAIRASQE